MNSLKNLEESMGCNTIRDDHGGGVIYQRVHMDKAAFDEMLGKVEKEYSGLQAENAKLRKLVRDMFGVIDDSEFDPIVERQGTRSPYYKEDMSWRVGIRDRMRELGIEVPHDN